MAWFPCNIGGGGSSGVNILKGTTEPTSAIGENGQLYLKYIDIANAYSLREYIEVGNTAGPYINTGLFWSQSNEFEVKAQFMAEPENDTFVFGCWVSYQDTNLAYGNGWHILVGGSGIDGQQYDTNAHIYKAEQNSILLDGSVLSGTPNWSNVPTNVPIAIFTDGARLTEKRIKNTRVYYVKIWDNGELTHYFVPAIRNSDNEIGMLDIMTNTFYDNDGSGDFTISSTERTDIEGKPIVSSFAKVSNVWQNLIGTDVDDIQSSGEGDSPIETKELIYSIDESQGGVWVNSNIDTTLFTELYFRYTDSVSSADYTAIIRIEDIAVYTGGADVFTTVFPSAVSGLAFNVRIYNNELYVSFSGAGTNTKVVGIYKKITVKGNATVKQGTFVSASSQFGIVDVDCGFKPDLVMVRLSFGNNDTTSYWEKGMSWAETKSIWNLYPAETVVYVVDLGRITGETGIQAINNNGFSFMSNGGNTQGVTCEYVAVKYETVPTPTGDVYTIEQGNTQNAEDATAVNAENGKLYMFFTGNHSGSFTNANLIVGSLSYFELLDGIGVAAAIIQATSNTITYDGAWSGNYSITEIDILKNGAEDLSIECLDKSNNSWASDTSISANVGDYFLIADTVDNESGTIVGADVLLEEVLTSPPTALNIKIRIIKATSTAISLSSGNNLYYRKFGLVKEI